MKSNRWHKPVLTLLALTMIAAQPVSARRTINFQLTDITGKTLRLSDHRGKWVLVNFWAPWCPLCWQEVPVLNELNQRRDFVVIAVGLDYGSEENPLKQAAKQHNFEVSAIVAGGPRRDTDSPYRQVGPVDFYPTSYLYDPNGEIVMFIPGLVKRDKIQGFVDQWRRGQERK
jgi:thiol-disulfide isomerase/thioredoxin